MKKRTANVGLVDFESIQSTQDQLQHMVASGMLPEGEYFDRINGGEWMHSFNIVPTEGISHILNVALGSKAKPSAYYLALFSGSTAPSATWNAAQFSAVASEIVSQTEGYGNATRPAWTPAETNTNSIDNIATAAQVTIVTSGTLTVTGAALLTTAAKGSTTGALISAAKFPVARTFQNGDVYEIGYRLSLTV